MNIDREFIKLGPYPTLEEKIQKYPLIVSYLAVKGHLVIPEPKIWLTIEDLQFVANLLHSTFNWVPDIKISSMVLTKDIAEEFNNRFTRFNLPLSLLSYEIDTDNKVTTDVPVELIFFDERLQYVGILLKELSVLKKDPQLFEFNEEAQEELKCFLRRI